MWFLRILSGFIWVAGPIWFIPASWSLYFRNEMDSVDAWHHLMAGCAFFVIAALVNIYDKLDQIAKKLGTGDSASKPKPDEKEAIAAAYKA
jgi:hypothetical protein